MTNNWRISVFNSAGKWQGFTLAASEEEARAQVAQVRRPGDRAVVACWNLGDYRDRFTVTDEGES